jgi:hypothetical protein
VKQCMARPRSTRWPSKIDERESCINVSGLLAEQFAPDHHGYPRASRLTTGKTSLGHHGTQSRGCAGQTVRPTLHSISQTSAEEAIDVDLQCPSSVRFWCCSDQVKRMS